MKESYNLLQNLVDSWENIVDKDSLFQALNRISIILNAGIKITPEPSEVFNSFRFCHFDRLKVIILGQDPYPQEGIATGIAFANKRGSWETSPSLNVIRKSVEPDDLPMSEWDPSLLNWCEQGVLLLNSALTTEINKIGVHYDIWRPFIKSLVIKVSTIKPDTIFVLLGEQAKTFAPFIYSKNIITGVHPAALIRNGRDSYPVNNNPFRQINDKLTELGKSEIIWFN